MGSWSPGLCCLWPFSSWFFPLAHLWLSGGEHLSFVLPFILDILPHLRPMAVWPTVSWNSEILTPDKSFLLSMIYVRYFVTEMECSVAYAVFLSPVLATPFVEVAEIVGWHYLRYHLPMNIKFLTLCSLFRRKIYRLFLNFFSFSITYTASWLVNQVIYLY